tara:strand:- start:38 stop:364 length:327 start_codon:yes stop_codon:yes gene_type:complete
MDVNKLQRIKNEITKLDKIHHLKIFKLLKDNEVKFSENRNGIFINMATIDENTIKLIENALIYIKEQEKELKDIESFKKDLKNDFFITNSKAVKDNSTLSYNNVNNHA